MDSGIRDTSFRISLPKMPSYSDASARDVQFNDKAAVVIESGVLAFEKGASTPTESSQDSEDASITSPQVDLCRKLGVSKVYLRRVVATNGPLRILHPGAAPHLNPDLCKYCAFCSIDGQRSLQTHQPTARSTILRAMLLLSTRLGQKSRMQQSWAVLFVKIWFR